MTQIELILDIYKQICKTIAVQHNIIDQIQIEKLADEEMDRIKLMLEASNKPYFYNDRMFYAYCIDKVENELIKFHKGDMLLDHEVYRLLNRELDFWKGRLAEFEKYERFD